MTLELAPGSVVSERELMERLGVGRTPVREALRDLARERLVDVFPRRGIFVSGVDVGDIAGLSEVRLVLEGKAARLAAERRSEADRPTEDLLDELARRSRQADERLLIDLDQRIHRHVYRCTHNPFLEATLEEYYVLTLRIWFLALDRVERLDDAIREHREILEAIRDRDRRPRGGGHARPRRGLRAGDPRRPVRRQAADDQRRSVGPIAPTHPGDTDVWERVPSSPGVLVPRRLIYQPRRPMSDAPSAARAVVIGCGIVGNSLAYHLTRLGWTDVVLLDKGPLPNPGGSTGHASNFIFLVDHSKEMTQLTLESVRQYRELDVLTECGGIEVARTEERMEELRRRMASAKSWGIEPVSLVTPAEIKELVPYIDESILLGGFYTPGVGVVDSLRAGTIMRERGVEAGALTVLANTEVAGMDVEGGRIRRVAHVAGTIEAETVVIACGVWSPLLARMAGAHIPLTPMVHQMIDVGPVPRFEKRRSAIEYPIVRDMDVFMYERQDGDEPRDRLVRPPLDPPRPGGDPLDRGGRALADRVPVHAGGLRPADGGRARPDAGDRRRRVGRREVRDQRPDLADAGRDADPRRDARGQGPLVGGRRVGQGRARGSASPWRSGWCTASRTSTSTRPTSAASTPTRRRGRT